MSAGAAQPKPVRRVGRYALYNEIASGGMATVYLGRQQGQAGFARTVAIKRLHPQHAKEPDFVAMFLDEARLAARIRHPNVVPTLDVVATEGELFLIMDFVQGESLSRLLRASRQQGGPPPVRIAAAIMADVLHGLHAAHEATNERGEALGMVHRDVSPHNILVGVDGVARVVDFGVAKASGRIQTTREGQLKGKIAYMAPEQITGTVTRRTDVYAASVVLWEALTAKRLFAGENDVSVMNQVVNSKISPPSAHVEGLDPAWDDIVLRGLDRDEAARFATAREMALEIEQRFQLARATEVGEWVGSLAHETLARRAAEVTAVESASDVEVVPHEAPGEVRADSPIAAESTASRLSAVSRPLPSETPPHGRSRMVIGLGLAAVLVLGAFLLLRPGAPATTPAPAASPSMPAAATTAPTPTPVPPAPPAPSEAVSSLPQGSASAPLTASAAPAPVTPPSRPARPARTRPDAPPASTKGTSLGSVLDTRR